MITKKNLDKIYDSRFFTESKSQIEIVESENNSKINSVIIKDDVDFLSINNDFTENLNGGLFSSNQTLKDALNKKCDGTVIFGKKDQKFIYLIELKSGFNPSKITLACKQIISTYMKINILLSFLTTHTKDNYKFSGFIVMQNPRIENFTTISKKMEKPDWRFAYNLQKNKSLEIPFSKIIKDFSEMPLHWSNDSILINFVGYDGEPKSVDILVSDYS